MRIKSYNEGQIDERQRILKAIKEIEETSHKTRTPIFQDKLISLMKKVVSENVSG